MIRSLARLLSIIGSVIAVGCADSMTGPAPVPQRNLVPTVASRDTIPMPPGGQCPYGYSVATGFQGDVCVSD